MRPALRLRYHRGTTANLASLQPFGFATRAPLDAPLVGVDLAAGGSPYTWDPFAAYAAGATTNPNVWILGEPGNGKSALVKTLLARMAATYGLGARGRWIAIVDPKGEYGALAGHLGLTAIRLHPGGTERLNPLDDLAHPTGEAANLRRPGLVAALLAGAAGRALTTIEDAVVFETVAALPADATLDSIAALLRQPPAHLEATLGVAPAAIAEATVPLRLALDKLLSRSLRGMFDGPSTVRLDPDGPGVVIDLSGVAVDSDALPLIMVAAAGWLSHVLLAPGPQRVQVLDEAWALLGNRHTAGYLQQCFKLGRTYGIANVCVAHRVSDLSAQADDGTATAKIAAGLLADAATKIVLRQAADQLDAAGNALGLTGPERDVVARLARGRALWRVGADSAVVAHLMTADEHRLVDTDTRMRAGS
jgi:type IV secretory pathway VirB4 component